MTSQSIDSCSGSENDRDVIRIHSRFPIDGPEILPIFFTECRVNEGYIIASDIFDIPDGEELIMLMGYLEESRHRGCERLIEIESDVSMSIKKRWCQFIGA